MYVGVANPNMLIPVEKMRITNLDAKSSPKYFEVLYNPQTYTREKVVNYSPVASLGADAPVVQFLSGAMEVLTFELFFDSVSAGAEIGGQVSDRLKFEGNSLLPTITGGIDVRDYTKKITDLMYIDSDKHRPPELKVEWSSLQFKGFLSKCEQRFVRFDEQGQPVRAFLNCTFIEHRDVDKQFVSNPLNSPDTTKYHTVRQGDSLWSLAAEEYGDPGQWRAIAAANGLTNPRRLRTGEMLVVPALL
ncbi:MAG: LysM peptidoglycan-binding domain-containing protein [Ruminococcaceae bacterium]|jgi:LysM repeat protein|nr:LysM peptidoglycan-binding domain-containing protein [Oscillospiraceae bacterium]